MLCKALIKSSLNVACLSFSLRNFPSGRSTSSVSRQMVILLHLEHSSAFSQSNVNFLTSVTSSGTCPSSLSQPRSSFISIRSPLLSPSGYISVVPQGATVSTLPHTNSSSTTPLTFHQNFISSIPTSSLLHFHFCWLIPTSPCLRKAQPLLTGRRGGN